MGASTTNIDATNWATFLNTIAMAIWRLWETVREHRELIRQRSTYIGNN
jgi:hypothetical protein